MPASKVSCFQYATRIRFPRLHDLLSALMQKTLLTDSLRFQLRSRGKRSPVMPFFRDLGITFSESVARRSRLQLTRDEGFDHGPRAIGLRPFVGDPFVLRAFEDLELNLAAGGFVRSNESFLNLRQHVIV